MFNNTKYEDISKAKTKKIFRVQWHLTERCNLRCIHCYQDNYSKHKEINIEEMKKAAKMLKKTTKKWNMKCEVSITGGEPFIRKEWFEFCKYLEELGFFISILTNGTLLTDSILNKLKTLRNLRYVQISLDGGTKEIHEKVRGDGSFEKAITAIKMLKKNAIKVSTKFTVHKINLNDLTNYLDLTEELQVNFVSAARYVPSGPRKNIKKYFLTRAETKEVYEQILYYAKKNKGKIVYDTRRPLWILLQDQNTNVGGRCVAGINGLTILPNGDVLPCRPMGIKVGNVIENTFFEIWYTSDILWKIRNYKNWECGRCNYNKTCGGCLAISNGIHNNFFKSDPQCFKNEIK